MNVKVLFFGPAQTLAGVDAATVELPAGACVADLRDRLCAAYPQLAPGIRAIRFAVNQSFAPDTQALRPDDEVALIPPVSGGTREPDFGPAGAADRNVWVEIVDGPIPMDRLLAFVHGQADAGGIVLFEGVTRAESDAAHGPLKRLEYTAYREMALQEMERLASRAKERFKARRVAIVHRVGAVAIGQSSVAIAVACPHRAEAFNACRFVIDKLKQDVPIWKKDMFEDGRARWVEPEGGGNLPRK